MEDISIDSLKSLLGQGIVKFNYELLLEKRYEHWIKKGDVVVDVGAHNGRHLRRFIALTGRSGKVIGFEPIPVKFARLKKYYDDKCLLINSALSFKTGEAEFIVAEGALQESGLKQRIYNKPKKVHPRSINVTLETLDSYSDVISGVRFIKIDVEGGEIDSLLGSVNILEKYRPLVSVEYGEPSYSVYGNTKWTLFDFCEKHKYVLYDIFLNRLNTREKWSSTVDSISWDYFMVPCEKELEFIELVIKSDKHAPLPGLLFQHKISEESDRASLVSGFSDKEAWGAWTDKKEAVLSVKPISAAGDKLILNVLAHGFVNDFNPTLSAKVIVDDSIVGEMKFSKSDNEPKGFFFTIPNKASSEYSRTIKFVIDDPKSPESLGMSNDARLLGIGLRTISIHEKI